MLIGAILLGIFAVFIARSYLSDDGPRAEIAAPVSTVQVVVAKKPLKRGQKLTRPDLQTVPWPIASKPATAFTSIDTVLKGGDRIALTEFAAGEPLVADKLSGEGARASLSIKLDPAMRAVAMRIGDVAGVGGFVLPGDRVDVLLTHAPQGEGEAPYVTVLAQNVRVLATDQDADEGRDAAKVSKSATIEVTPDQAQQFQLASTIGTLNLALRNIGNIAPEVTRVVRVTDIGGRYPRVSRGSAPAVAGAPMRAAPGPARAVVPVVRAGPGEVLIEVVRGGERTKYAVPT